MDEIKAMNNISGRSSRNVHSLLRGKGTNVAVQPRTLRSCYTRTETVFDRCYVAVTKGEND